MIITVLEICGAVIAVSLTAVLAYGCFGGIIKNFRNDRKK